MRHFFRLLFISFGLLLFLGINAHQSTEPLENELTTSLSLDTDEMKVLTAPMVQSEINMGKCIISGKISKEEAEDIKTLLET